MLGVGALVVVVTRWVVVVRRVVVVCCVVVVVERVVGVEGRDAMGASGVVGGWDGSTWVGGVAGCVVWAAIGEVVAETVGDDTVEGGPAPMTSGEGGSTGLPSAGPASVTAVACDVEADSTAVVVDTASEVVVASTKRRLSADEGGPASTAAGGLDKSAVVVVVSSMVSSALMESSERSMAK